MIKNTNNDDGLTRGQFHRFTHVILTLNRYLFIYKYAHSWLCTIHVMGSALTLGGDVFFRVAPDTARGRLTVTNKETV